MKMQRKLERKNTGKSALSKCDYLHRQYLLILTMRCQSSIN